jgi:hypothetical protein
MSYFLAPKQPSIVKSGNQRAWQPVSIGVGECRLPEVQRKFVDPNIHRPPYTQGLGGKQTPDQSPWLG